MRGHPRQDSRTFTGGKDSALSCVSWGSGNGLPSQGEEGGTVFCSRSLGRTGLVLPLQTLLWKPICNAHCLPELASGMRMQTKVSLLLQGHICTTSWYVVAYCQLLVAVRAVGVNI